MWTLNWTLNSSIWREEVGRASLCPERQHHGRCLECGKEYSREDGERGSRGKYAIRCRQGWEATPSQPTQKMKTPDGGCQDRPSGCWRRRWHRHEEANNMGQPATGQNALGRVSSCPQLCLCSRISSCRFHLLPQPLTFLSPVNHSPPCQWMYSQNENSRPCHFLHILPDPDRFPDHALPKRWTVCTCYRAQWGRAAVMVAPLQVPLPAWTQSDTDLLATL